jgi:hypothetical protein
MPKVKFLRPIDQPTGKLRLLGELIQCFESPHYSHFNLAVGFAKSGPLYRLAHHIREWRSAGKTIEGIFGIDHRGTSQQALRFALAEFDKVFVTTISSSRRATFHPKLYLFYSDKIAACFYGSHNLTVGGTETNFEGGVKIELDRSDAGDESLFQEMLDCWISLLPQNCPVTRILDKQLFNDFLRDDLLLDEAASPSVGVKSSSSVSVQAASKQQEVSFRVKPPSSIPKGVLAPPKTKVAKEKAPKAPSIKAPSPPGITTNALVIQIIPHPNGEIFLSKIAVNQNPIFFGFPFTGQAAPKKASNPPYPQHVPDPIVNIEVFDKNGFPITALSRTLFNLNMVYYESKSEIRITVNPDLARQIPKYSVLVISKPDDPASYDYDMKIYFPGSNLFNDYLSTCNQTLPSGGAKKPRKMGWL